MNAPEPPRVRVEVLRDAVRRAVAASSSHQVAKAVGLSAPAVRNFMAGAEPHPANHRKLTAWYVRQAADAHELDEDTAHAALSLLLEAVPELHRGDGMRRVLEAVREAHEVSGAPLPSWLVRGGHQTRATGQGELGTGDRL